ncbi:MAG TPA: ABC transporter permease [Vicinamibacterales bacterium]
MGSFAQDVQYGLRSLYKNPGFAAVAILTLALGVGANTAIFSVLRAVVLRDLPYHEPHRIAVMWTKNIRQNLPDGSSYLNFRDWKEQSKEFQAMAAYYRPEFTRGTLSGGPGAERVHVGAVGPGFFELLGATPILGRTFEASDFTNPPHSIVIANALWRQRFGGDRNVVGRKVQFSDMNVEVIGVMPPEFELPTPDVQVWQPVAFEGAQWLEPPTRGRDSLVVIGRLADSASFASARAELDTIAARLRAQYPATNAALGVTTDPLTDKVIGQTTERSLWMLFGSVGFVLLIACANVANLVLARATARRNEYSVRTALGASTTRLVRQTLTENLALGVLAGLVGLFIAWAGTIALRNVAPGALPRAEGIHVDRTVLLFLLAASLGSGLIAGLLPAIQLSTTKPADVLKESSTRAQGGPTGRRLHRTLVIVEIALAVVLLSGAGLLLRSFQRVRTIDRGFDSQNVLLLQIDLPGAYDNNDKVKGYFTEATRRIRALPGVVAVGAISDFFIHRQPDYHVALEGWPPKREDDPAPPLTEDQVVPGYFEAMRIPLIRGRLLRDSDLAAGAEQVIVINEEMARRFWPGQDALGRRLKYGLDPGANRPWKTVVGVVADMRRQRLDEAAIPYMFQPGAIRQMDIAVRTMNDPDASRDAIRAELRALDPSAPPYGIVTVEQRLGRTVALRRLQTMLLAALAAVALVLSMIGAYGVIHQSIASRTQEIGIRMALGANASAVLRMVLAGGMTPALTGLGLGLLGSLALSRTIGTFLYETDPFDPLIYAGVTALLLLVTTVACLAPARRAARFDPVSALRGE